MEKATLEDKLSYKEDLKNSLNNLEYSDECLNCRDIRCKNVEHIIGLDDFVLNLLETVETSTKRSIPYSSPKTETPNKASQRKYIPGWKEHVHPLKEEAVFWYAEWRYVGKPRTGVLYDQMRFSRNQFRYAKRKCLNAASLISRDRFVESCLSGDKDLFAELNKFKGSPQNIATKVDGHTDLESIADNLKGI